MTSDERVACESSRAAADRIVIYHFAPRSDTTGSQTRISTFLIVASLISAAVGIDNAFGSAGRRHTKHPRQTGTDRLAVHRSALAVGTAG